MWGNICAFPHILGSPSLYMTLQLLYSEFPYIWGKFDFLFYQCSTPSPLPSAETTALKYWGFLQLSRTIILHLVLFLLSVWLTWMKRSCLCCSYCAQTGLACRRRDTSSPYTRDRCSAFSAFTTCTNGNTLSQCCGSGTGIRCPFDPWIRDPGSRIPNQYFWELSDNFLGQIFFSSAVQK